MARSARERLGVGDAPLGDLAGVLEQFSLYPLVVDHDVDGASMLVADGVGVAVIGGGRDPGRRRFTAAHELGHHLSGDAYTVDMGTSNDERERDIDRFASEFLLPSSVVAAHWPDSDDHDVRRRFLIRVAATYRVSWSTAVKAARTVGALDRESFRRIHARRPVDGDFLSETGAKPIEDLVVGTTGPRWRKAVVAAYERGLVTDARAIELLRGLVTAAELPAVDDGDEL